MQTFNADGLEHHRSALYAMALRELGDPVLAEDLVQETFVAALGGAGARFAGRSSVRTWLTGILKHKIMDALRQRAKAPSSFDDATHRKELDEGSLDADDHVAIGPADRPGADAGPLAAFSHKRFLEACQQSHCTPVAAPPLAPCDHATGRPHPEAAA